MYKMTPMILSRLCRSARRTGWPMRQRLHLFLALPVIVASGCAATPAAVDGDPSADKALVLNTADRHGQDGHHAAYIYEIDGRTVSWQQRAFLLEPGRHTFRVWPRLDMAESLVMIPDIVRIRRESIEVAEIELLLEPGYVYQLGARTNIGRTVSTIPGSDRFVSRDQTFIVPILLSAIRPKTLAEGAQGMSVFLAIMGAGPLAAGGL